MTYHLEEFACECHEALKQGADAEALENVRKCVSRACSDAEFVATHLGSHNTNARKLLYEDEGLKFCIFAHVYDGPQVSKPHDHGPSWAIYGQALGKTQMTDWRVVDSPSGAEQSVQALRTYEMAPGDAHVYDVGVVHSPERAGETRLIRIEGINMDGVKRRWFDLP